MNIRKKSGKPVEADFENPLFIQSFSQICRELKSSSLGVNVNEKRLANISYGLQTYLEDKFGRNSEKPRAMTKLSSSFFKNFEPHGPLYIILYTALAFENTKGLTNFDFSKLSKDDQGLSLLHQMEAKLVKEGYLVYPRIYLSESVAHLTKELTQYATNHGAKIVSNVVEATHIIEWDEEVDGSLPEILTEEYIRTLEIKADKNDESYDDHHGNIALVHWWYHPDSYDEWIPAQDVDYNLSLESLSSSTSHPNKQWVVCCRFLRDVELFNEWGNEYDYEIDNNEKDDADDSSSNLSERVVSRGRKSKKAARRKAEELKRRQKEQQDVQPIQVIPEAVLGTERMCQDAIPPSNDTSRDSVRVLDFQKDKEGTIQCIVKDEKPILAKGNQIGRREEEEEVDDENDDADYTKKIGFEKLGKRKLNASDDQSLSHHPFDKKKHLSNGSSNSNGSKSGSAAQSSKSSINIQPDWYSSDKLSPVEVKCLPEFFDGSSPFRTPHVYMRLRSYIVTLYQQNPSIYLSATQCRKLVAGDVCAIIRVHQFLDAFGVINYDIKPEARPPCGFVFPLDRLQSTEQLIGSLRKDHTTSLASTMTSHSSSSSGSGGSKSSNNASSYRIHWTPEQDAALISAIVTSTKSSADSGQSQSQSGGPGLDWGKVSVLLAIPGRTAADCLARLVELPLPAPLINGNGHSTEDKVAVAPASALPSVSSSSSDYQQQQQFPRGSRPGIREASMTLTRNAVMALGTKRAGRVARAAIDALSECFQDDSSGSGSQGEKHPITSADITAAASFGISAAALVHFSNEESNQLYNQEKLVVDAYVLQRLQIIEEKMKLIEAVEQELELERQRLDAYRKDLQVQKAQMSFILS